MTQPFDGLWKIQVKRIVRKITSPLLNYLSEPLVTVENSCVPGFELSLPVYPEVQAFNSFSILKYFILSQHLRDRTRFLTNDDFEISLQNTEMAGQFMMSFKLAFLVGIIMAMPFILWQIWRFIKPALSNKEIKNTRGFVFYTTGLFLTGVAFGYFILCPISINFFARYSLSTLVKNEINIQSIVSFMSVLVLGTGLIFELPVLMYFLARIGIITSEFLKKYRKYAFIIILIIAAIVTPPDIVSQVILTIPLYTLFEMGVIITKRVEKQKKQDEQQFT